MMNKYGSTLVIATKNDKDDDDDERRDRESQQLLSADATTTTTTAADDDTNNESSSSSVDIVANRKNALYYVSLLLFVTVFVVVGIGSRSSFFHFFSTHSRSHEMEISAIPSTTSVATTTIDSSNDADADADADMTTTTTASSAASSSSSSSEIGHDIIKVHKDKVDDIQEDDKQTQKENSSPFFRVVLPWKQETMADSSEDDGDDDDKDTTSSKSSRMSNHYQGVLEFCSDAEKGLYGYGLLGECIPGQPSPLIRMKPKTFYQLTLVNNGQVATNIHTHGLHVSGVGTVDDVTRLVEPGNCLTYDYYILDDADVGTYWYHPHWHPLVTTTAYGGAYGMLIVDETIKDYYPTQLENFLRNPLTEVLLQFSSMYNKKASHPFRNNKVNGQNHLQLTITPDQYYYVRVSSVVYAESINYIEFIPHDACDVRPLAYDGVYRSEIPYPTSLNKHMMTVSSRVDLSLRCHEDAVIHFHQGKGLSDVTNMVSIHVVDYSTTASSDDTNNDPSDVTLLSSSSSTSSSSSPYWDQELQTTWTPRRPYYMPNLADTAAVVDETWYVSMDDYYKNGTKGVSVNQQAWDPDIALRTFDVGELVEFPILLSEKGHPFHFHINRMQIVEPGGCGGRYEEGEYYDTIVLLPKESKNKKECNVRIKFFDFAGRIVIHCHRFGHEDKGMMTWIDVLGGHGHGMEGASQTNCSAVL